MLEWLAVSTGVELGKLVLTQVLDLSKPVLESYVQDFFKDCLAGGVARLKANQLKQPMAEAIGAFIQRFLKELQFHDVPDTSLDHHYRAALRRFVQEPAVRPILGKAFEKGCKQIDHGQLADIWMAQYQQSGWQFPAEDFDWRGVTKEYILAVKGIIKADAELRAILDSDLLEDIARNTTPLSPGFDVITYRNSLQTSYGYLKLYTLDSTDRTDAIRLWRMFIEPSVREALPPTRTDLPLDLKRQLQEQGQLDANLSPEALSKYRREYFQQPVRKVLATVADVSHAVILGDPGSGKSTLLQFLALDWVEGKTEALPLLIELREYALAQSQSFLDFLHRGNGADWQFDQHQLHQHLLDNPTLVMFDGLDEVFDRPTQATIIDDIIRFAQQYPQARVLVTSRIIGYQPERFQHAGFRQFTIQPLDESEIHEFIDRWYDLSMGSDPDKARLKQRLKDAIANSKAIRNLADNPLLLTMMAILNQEKDEGLPQNKIDLYDQASELLLHRWDSEFKHDLKDPRWNKYPVEVDHRDKQAMLRQVAYSIQESSYGLSGNLIAREDLQNRLKSYLKNVLEAPNAPSIAKLLINQLHKRDSVLCHYGCEAYGFVHRTFLEYFCAVEIVHRFEKQRTLTFDQLRDDIFGQHWQDETWHEVLCLVCGLINEKLVGKLIEFLAEKGFNYFASLDLQEMEMDGVLNCILACNCLREIKNIDSISKSVDILLETLKGQMDHIHFDPEVIEIYFECIIKNSKNKNDVLDWLRQQITENIGWSIRWGAVWALVKHDRYNPKTLPLIYSRLQEDENEYVRAAVLSCLDFYYCDNVEALSLTRQSAKNDAHPLVRTTAIEILGRYGENSQNLGIFYEQIQLDEDSNVRQSAVFAFAENHPDDKQVSSLLKSLVQADKDQNMRTLALRGMVYHFSQEAETFDLLCHVVQEDQFKGIYSHQENPREIALKVILKNHSKHPRTLRIVQDCAKNDSDDQLRQWAQEQLEQLKIQNGN